MGTSVSPVEIARKGVEEARRLGVDAVIVDTAGRLQVCGEGVTMAFLPLLGTRSGHFGEGLALPPLFSLSSPSPLPPPLQIDRGMMQPELIPLPPPFVPVALQIDGDMMQELKDIKSAVKPTDTLLVVDAMTGQEAANLVKTFNDEVDITGVCACISWRYEAVERCKEYLTPCCHCHAFPTVPLSSMPHCPAVQHAPPSPVL